MRRATSSVLTLGLLSAVLGGALVALPTVTRGAGAAPRPVQADVEQVPLSGVDAGSLPGLRRAGSPAPLLLSAPLTGKRFSLLGVTWREDPAVEVAVRVREHRADRGWSAWEAVEAETDDAPDAGSPDTRGVVRGGTAPLWTGPSDGVQVRVDAVAGPRPQDVRLELVDPGTSPADALVPAPRDSAGASEPQPEIISRAAWGADESIRRGSPSYTSPAKVGFVHHTASSNDYSPEQAAAMVRGIYAYHVKSNGWSDIGYNFLVDKYGRAYEGRAGGMDRCGRSAPTPAASTRARSASRCSATTRPSPRRRRPSGCCRRCSPGSWAAPTATRRRPRR